MRKLIVLSFITLDGVMQAPGGPEEDPTGGFKYEGWVAGYSDDFLLNVMIKQTSKPFDLLLGRKTYEIFAAYWPYVNAHKNPFAAKLNNAKKYVASKTLTKLDWNNSELIDGDVTKGIKRIKEQDGPEIQVHGSGNLIQTLLKHDLVEELWLKIFPVTLGVGKRLFAEGVIPAGFKVLESGISSSGVIIASYEHADEVKTGSLGLETPSEAELARRKRVNVNAVNCACSMIKVIREGLNPILNQYAYPELNVRIGIDLGENAVVQYGWETHTIDGKVVSKKPQLDILGYTMSIATKMTALAKPDRIIIGQLVYDVLDDKQKSTFKLLPISPLIWNYSSSNTGNIYHLYVSITENEKIL